MAINMLLIEGPSDRIFFEKLLQHSRTKEKVAIGPPSMLGRFSDTVSSFPSSFKHILNQMYSEKVAHVGAIADADHHSGGGFDERWKALTAPLTKEQMDEQFKDIDPHIGHYNIPQAPPRLPATGSIFKHNQNILPPFGLYLLPTHQTNGMLENLLWENLIDEHGLKPQVEKAVKAIENPLFSDIHEIKALLYTWVAWQRSPGHTLDRVIPFINKDSAQFKGLINWFEEVFPFLKDTWDWDRR